MIDLVLNDYFEWMIDIVGGHRYIELLKELHSIEYTFENLNDENRAHDGEDLRWRYVCDGGNRRILKWCQPCTVLEMLVALAIKMEDIMDNPNYGDRVDIWFWEMMTNMELDTLTDSHFDEECISYVHERIDIMLNRWYAPDGTGGLYHLPDCKKDLRDVEVWFQMCWYLDSIMYKE